VANLVGIILILIMVVGTQAKNAFVAAQDDQSRKAPAEPSPQEQEIASVDEANRALENDFKRLADRIAREQFEVQYRRAERDRLSKLVAAAEATLSEKRAELSTAQRDEYDLFAELNAARRELRDLKLAEDAAANAHQTPGIIEHLPTPLAKTVFGKELHLRLAGGRIAYVPMSELVDQLKEDAQRNSWKLKNAPEMTETLGPIDGFRMQYTLHLTERVMAGGAARGRFVELKRFVLLPLSEDLGEPIHLALADKSATRSLLKQHPPQRTTITVWVYPDSFPDFRRFKSEMFKLGYSTAGRPLPAGHPIGGSPDGSSSAAQ
jgi:hypothetical protein